MSEQDLDQSIRKLLKLTTDSGGPQCNSLNETLRVLPYLALDVKNIAYEVSRLRRELNQRTTCAPSLGRLSSKLCTAADLESSWAAYWMRRLKISFGYHRKTWEKCFVLQALYENLGSISGSCGLGFACGTESLPSLLASLGAAIIATDAPPETAGVDKWTQTQQHSSGAESLFYPDLISRDDFERHVRFEFVDMNEIPEKFGGKFDFCWSICAAEHLGSIEKELRFIENSLDVLKPGGVAVHTLEFNLDAGETIDNWLTVLVQRKHIEELEARVAGRGGVLLKPDYDEGDSFEDRYIDMPPYDIVKNEIHLKLEIDGFRCTCIGLILRKPE